MQTETVSSLSVGQSISQAINHYTSQKGKGLSQISYYTDVSPSYVRRLSIAEIPEEKIDPIKAFAILRFIKDFDFAYKMIDSNPSWSKRLSLWTGFQRPDQKQRPSERANLEKFIITDNRTILAFIMACDQRNTSWEELKEAGGRPLEEAAKFLMECDVLSVQNGKIVPVVDHFTFSKTALKKVIPVLSSFYRIEHSGENYIFAATERLPKEIVQELRKKMRGLRQWYSKKVLEAQEARPQKDDVSFFFTMAMDFFPEYTETHKGDLQ